MLIWLITIGEPIFHPLNKLRLHRTGILAKYISENTDHEIVWWTSTFNHFTKKHMFEIDTCVKVSAKLRMEAIKGCGYSRNVSVSRIIDHLQLQKKIEKKIDLENKKPDIIIASFPTLGLTKSAIKYGKKYNVPVIIDYRDMWPEVYVELFPSKLQNLAKNLLYPLFSRVEKVFKQADGIFGITNDFLNLALKKAGRSKIESDDVFPLGYLKNQYSKDEIKEADNFWSLKLSSNKNVLRICFFGAIGYQSNWDTICNSMKIIKEENLNIEIIICGSGDKLEDLKLKCKNYSNIKFPGFVTASQIVSLMNVSDIGLCAYYPKEAYLNSIPGKAIEYMSASLPILSTLKSGTLGKLIDENQIGYHYEHNSEISLINAIKEIILDKDRLLEKKEIIKNIYFENFDSSTVYKSYLDKLEKIVLNNKKQNE